MSRSWDGRPPKMDKEKAKEVLLEVKSVLDKNEVEFWLCFATCLGAVREGGFIEEDFDIDLAIKHDVLLPKLGTLTEQFVELGYDIKLLSTPYSYNRMIKLDKNDVRVDFVNWDLYVDNFSNTVRGYYFHPVEPDGKCHVFQREMFDNLQPIQFLGETFLTPFPVEMYLELLYGNWKVKDLGYNFMYQAKCLQLGYWDKIKAELGEGRV